MNGDDQKDVGQDRIKDVGSRENARAILKRDIKHAQHICQRAGLQVIQLGALLDSLPEYLIPEADQALYDLLMAGRRNRLSF